MVHLATGFFICLSLIIIFCTVCLAECGKCPRERVPKSLYYDVFGSASEHQNTVPLDDDACYRSNKVHFPSTLHGFQSESLSARNLDIDKNGLRCTFPGKSIRSYGNVSWSLDDTVFHLLDGGAIKCSSNYIEFDYEELPSNVNGVDQIGVSSCKEHLPSKKETFFTSQNIEIQKSPFSYTSSPRVSIIPSKLNWEQSHMYHSSLASLRLENTCNESVLTVYEVFSTDSQFYSFNFNEVILGPGQVTTLTLAYLPNRLGSSSAELVLLTSFGGFLVEAKGFAVESPHNLKPLSGFDASSRGWLSKKLSLFNPFDKVIGVEEVTASISVYRGSGLLLVESICRKQNVRDSNKHSFLYGDNIQSEHMVYSVRPLSNWLLSPHKTQTVMEMYLPDLKGKVIGAICMEILKPMEGEKDMLVVPFKAEIDKTDITSPLSVSVDTFGPCDANETTISISVRNHASHLLKIVKINEMFDHQKIFRIKYLEGLLLFPGTMTQVALMTYESSKFEYDSFLEMPDVSIRCKVEIQVNDSSSPLLEVPCVAIVGICSLPQQKSLYHNIGVDDTSNQAHSMHSIEKSPILTQALVGAELDENLHGLKAQGTMNGTYLLDNHEILFPQVLVGEYYAKSLTVSNPSDHPVVVQLILNSQETIDNCKSCGHHLSPSPSGSLYNDSTRVSGSGFSISDTTVTEAFLHPHGTGSLGPILFHPSGRCEWKSLAFIRSNFSGLETISLRGFGGVLSLVMLEGSEPMQRLDFHMNLPFPLYKTNIKVSSCCYKPLLKKLFALNAGDFPVVVKRIDVSGRECGLDGFVVHNCREFSLEPGESIELGLSYQSDYTMPLVQRELEFILAVGILVIPMQATLPLDVLSLCAQSVFWSDIKRYSWAVVLTVISMSLLWCTILYQGIEKTDRIEPSKTGHVKQGIIAGDTDRLVDSELKINPSSDGIEGVTLSPSFPLKSLSIENGGKPEVAAQPFVLTVKTRKEKRRRSRKKNTLIEVSSSQSGNSTPTSPLSPVTTLSPETCSPKMKPHDSFSPKTHAPARKVPNNQDHKSLDVSRKMETRAMLTPSATFPGLTRSTPSRLAMGPHSRAPGPKIHSQNAVQSVVNSRAEDDRFTYNIWGNHLSGVHLCQPNCSITLPSGSFFLRGPWQTLMINAQSPSVSKFCDDG